MTRVTTSGPLTDGRALRAADRLRVAVVDDVAEDTLAQVQDALGTFLKNPTGFYESQIRVSNAMTDRTVNDSGVVYGPWLAGVGSRNQTSRFKGYAHWRRATQRAQARVKTVTAASVRKHVKQMN